MPKEKSKICRECNVEKEAEEFAPNQYGKNNRVLRRPVCRECYSKKRVLTQKQRREYEAKNPKPKMGEIFICPICLRKYRHEFSNQIVLDHNHTTGEIRGWICGSCNASIGKFKEDPEILKRAILWLKGKI